MGRYVGYARVSTHMQEQNGNLDRQIQELNNYRCTQVYSEVRSRDFNQSDEVNRLIASLQPNDTVVISSIDRLTCDIHYFGYIYHQIRQHQARLLVLDQSQLEFDTPLGKQLVSSHLSHAQYDLQEIRDRNNRGNIKRGRGDTVPPETIRLIKEDRAKGVSVIDIAGKYDWAVPTIYKCLKE